MTDRPGGGGAARGRFLIIVGLPKAGTTFLHAQFAARPDAFAVPLHRKEVDYFRSGRDLGAYLALFGTEPQASHDRVFVDASPLYIDDVDATIDNIRACLAGQDVRIVICLRPHLERAFSHYLHDIAQNLLVVGQGSYNLYEPAVLAKYLFPLAARVQRLQAAFGADRVHGFAFGADNRPLEAMLRAFAGLPEDWCFDFSRNPAPGFTSPLVFYDEDRDSGVSLREGVFRLPARQMLVVNRQFSQLYPRISPRIGRAMMRGQSSIVRIFDTGRFSAASHDRIVADFAAACDLLGIDLPPEERGAVHVSRVSDSLPEQLIGKLERIDDLDSAVARTFEAPLRPTDLTTLLTPEPPGSVARCIAGVSASARRRDDGALSVIEHLARMETLHGLPPDWMDSLIRYLALRRRFDEIEALLARYGGAGSLFRVPNLKAAQAQARPPFDADELSRLAALGVAVQTEA